MKVKHGILVFLAISCGNPNKNSPKAQEKEITNSQTKILIDSPGYYSLLGIENDTLTIKYEPKPIVDLHTETKVDCRYNTDNKKAQKGYNFPKH